MLVDVHAHLNPRAPAAIPAARLATYAGLCNFDYVLVSNRDTAAHGAQAANVDETTANIATLEAAAEHARLVALYRVRPGAADSNFAAFVGALATNDFVGAVFAPAENGFCADDRRIEPYLGRLESIGRPALFIVTTADGASPVRVYAAARRHPRLNVVLCQGDPTPVCQTQSLEVARTARIKQDARLFVDTSYLSPSAVRTSVEQLGAERVLFGSNAPLLWDAHTPRQIAQLDELKRTLTPADFARVVGGNAAELFGLSGR